MEPAKRTAVDVVDKADDVLESFGQEPNMFAKQLANSLDDPRDEPDTDQKAGRSAADMTEVTESVNINVASTSFGVEETKSLGMQNPDLDMVA